MSKSCHSKIDGDGSDDDRLGDELDVETEPLPDRRVGRRTFIKGIGATAAAGVGTKYVGSPVGEAQAVVPLIAAGAVAIGASVSLGWALREFEIVGSNPPAQGLTPDTLKQQIYQTAKTRKSTNASTIVDNQNILDGVENTAYTDAKVAAIEALNAGKTESEVLSTAQTAINTYHTTIQKNLLKSWNEGVREAKSLTDLAESNTNVDVQTTIEVRADGKSGGPMTDTSYPPVENQQTLADNSQMTVETLDLGDPYSPITQTTANGRIVVFKPSETSSPDFSYLKADKWGSVWSTMEQKFTNVSNGISTWVTNVYGQVQSGDIAVSDLLTPREQANIMASEEGGSQAVADLIALNIPVDLEREATITIPSTGTTLRGSFGLTDETDGPIESGTTYDPSTFTGDVYFTTDVSLLEGSWDAFNQGIDGGTVTVTQEPYEGTILSVSTTVGETFTAPATDWTETTAGGSWTYDASNDLENPISQVDSMSYYSESESTQYETLNLSKPFTVDKIENTETGEEAQSATFTSTKPQDDTNYITQNEWDELEAQNQELIDKYEESQQGAGGANVPGAQQIADLLGVDVSTGAAIAVVSGVALVLLLINR